jgi:stage III sporulation protein AH
MLYKDVYNILRRVAMKKIKKNQVIIAVMTVALGVAGYINFSGNTLDLADSTEDEDVQMVINEEMQNEHIVLEEDLYAEGEYYDEDDWYDYYSEAEIGEEDYIELNSDTDEIGEAVLTSADTVSNAIVTAKMNREQVRSRTQEAYLEIINGESAEGISVEDATAAYLKLAENMGREADTETVLAAKGYTNAVVAISENYVDVIIEAPSLDDVERTQIEELVVRKTGYSVDQVVISCTGEE